MRRHRSTAILALVLTLALASGAWIIHARAGSDDTIEGVATVIDAGTIKINKNVVKLHGIIAPAARQKCKRGSLPWLCGAAARKHMVDLAQDKLVRCLKIGSYHGRCFVDGIDLSQNLVGNGWAVPDQTGAVYRDAEDKARKGKLGMWKYAK